MWLDQLWINRPRTGYTNYLGLIRACTAPVPERI